MENLKIVEYKPSYAAAVADMWRRSTDGWNGSWADETEENVLKAHENSTDFNTYLALLEEDVVGYCGLSEYNFDENALYISLLNARYDLHGKGIGRTLVCKAVERTKELGWPRVDLFTWPGNTKSVPLYKRCGFFYEKRDDNTHLMNFIPGVLNAEAFQEHFEYMNWYKDLKRTIDMEPDGIEENDFVFYEYLWEKEDKSLRVQFESKSRGIRLIETEDYLVEANIEGQKLVFGKDYEIKYKVINKSQKPLNISIKGKDNKNIDFSFNNSSLINEKEIIVGNFFVNEPNEKIGLFYTYPAVVSEVFINGKKVEFKIGIKAQYPANLSLNIPKIECYKNTTSSMYLDIENNYNEDVTFNLELPENEDIKILNRNLRLNMKAKEKNSLKIEYNLNNFTFYNESIKVAAEFENEERITFEKIVSAPLKGRNGIFGGKGEDYYIIANGPYSIKLDEFNALIIESLGEKNINNKIYFPMLGKPFSEEFSNKKPKSIEHYIEKDNIFLKATFVSEAFENIRVESIVKLAQNGIAEYYYEIYNDGNSETSNEITLCNNLFLRLNGCVLPYKNKYMQIPETANIWMESIDGSKLTENWLYIKNSNKSLTLWWHKELNSNTNEDYFLFEHELGKIPGKDKITTKPIYMALDVFKDWKELRNYVLGKNDSTNLTLENEFGMIVNENNPFVKEKFTLKVKQDLEKPLHGVYSIKLKNENFEKITKSFKTEDKVTETEFNVSIDKKDNKDIVTLEADCHALCSEESKLVFNVKDTLCESKIIEEQDHKVYSLNNGVMEIKASPTFSHVLYSLEYKDHQWLENSFPTPRAKSWFNPWFGGIGTLPGELSFRSVLQQNIKADFIKLEDNFKNQWEGIKVTLSVEKHDEFEGLEINEYYLLLPGVPVLCHTAEIIQNTGKFMDSKIFESFCFFNIDENIKNNWLKMKGPEGALNKYKVGISAMDIKASSSILFGSDTLKDKIQLYSNHPEAGCYGFINTHDNASIVDRHITLPHGVRKFTSPQFYIFTEDYIEDKLIKDLRNIRFE